MVLKASPRRRQGVKALREAKASPTPSKKRGRARGRSDWEMKGGARRLPELAGARPPPSSSSTAPAPARSGPQERGCRPPAPGILGGGALLRLCLPAGAPSWSGGAGAPSGGGCGKEEDRRRWCSVWDERRHTAGGWRGWADGRR